MVVRPIAGQGLFRQEKKMTRETCDKRAGALLWIIVAVVVLFVGFALIAELLNRIDDDKFRQQLQFHPIEVAIDMFVAISGYGNYPPSNDNSLPPVHPEDATPYGGANKLAEALVGWDMQGYHPESDFRADGQNVEASGATKAVYEGTEDNLEEREGPFMELENANPFTLGDIYEPSVLTAAGLEPNNYVLCDVYAKKRRSGKKTGMPILYYRADTSKSAHDVNEPDNPDNIYSYKDNYALLGLGVPGKPKAAHPMFADPGLFYKITKNDETTPASGPYRAKSYILISAGRDGLYGTKDDIYNFAAR